MADAAAPFLQYVDFADAEKIGQIDMPVSLSVVVADLLLVSYECVARVYKLSQVKIFLCQNYSGFRVAGIRCLSKQFNQFVHLTARSERRGGALPGPVLGFHSGGSIDHSTNSDVQNGCDKTH